MSFIIIILLCHIPYSVYSQAPTDTSYLLTIIIHDNFRNCHPFSYYVSMSRQLQNLKSTKLTEDNSHYKTYIPKTLLRVIYQGQNQY